MTAKKKKAMTRKQKIKASEETLKRLKKEYGIKSKPKLKPKKKSLFERAKTYLKAKPKPKPKPKPKKQKKITWPSGITTQKQFDELMQIKRKKKK